MPKLYYIGLWAHFLEAGETQLSPLRLHRCMRKLLHMALTTTPPHTSEEPGSSTPGETADTFTLLQYHVYSILDDVCKSSLLHGGQFQSEKLQKPRWIFSSEIFNIGHCLHHPFLLRLWAQGLVEALSAKLAERGVAPKSLTGVKIKHCVAIIVSTFLNPSKSPSHPLKWDSLALATSLGQVRLWQICWISEEVHLK